MRKNGLPGFLPDPYVPSVPLASVLRISPVAYSTGGVWTTNNDAQILPVAFPVDCTLYSMQFYAANGTGNYDLGLYSKDLALIASSGSTAMSAAGLKTLTLPEVRAKAGEILYAALACSSTSGSVVRILPGAVYVVRAGGGLAMASALPLPSTLVPVAANSTAFPVIAFGIR